jgi:hypothetical protein
MTPLFARVIRQYRLARTTCLDVLHWAWPAR